EINLRHLIEEAMHLLQKKAVAKQISLYVSAEDTIFFKGDKNRLKQILMNLIENALSYTPEKGKIHIDAFENEDDIVLEVKDNGIGIPEKEKERIFERFYRIDKARSRNSGGTGLGLSIVKYLVENFNDSIT